MYSLHPLLLQHMPASYGLIGYPLSHSFSPGYFKAKFEQEGITARYELFAIPSIDRYPDLLKHQPDLRGLNVTIPYKELVIPYIDELDSIAKEIGAVNCIYIKDKRSKGFNTDVTGFKQSLLPLLKPWHRNALVLGTGGASLAVAYVLKELGIAYRFVSRHSRVEENITYADLNADLVAAHQLIINTTPMGMYPDEQSCPDLAYDGIGEMHLLYDLIYNPGKTLFLTKGQQQGAAIKNGLEMLELQAEASWHIWNS